MLKKGLLLVLAACLLLVSACSGSSSVLPAETPLQSFEALSDDAGKVRILHIWPEQDALLEQILGTAAEENGFAVSVSSVKFGTSLNTLRAAHAAGAMYDLFAYRFEDFCTLKNEGILRDLSDSCKGLEASFYPNALAQYTKDGALYGIPCTCSGSLILYNRDLFTSCGWEIPEDQEAFASLLEEIHSGGLTPLAISGKPAGNRLNDLLCALTENRLNASGLLDDPQYLSRRFTDWGGRLAISANTVKRWSGSGFFGGSELAADDSEAIEAFLSGEAAMLYTDISGINAVSSSETFGAFQIGAFLLPPCKKGQEQLFSGSGFHTAFGVWSETEHPAEASALLSALNTKDSLTAFAGATGSLLAAKDIAYEDELQNTLSPFLKDAGRHLVSPDYDTGNVPDLTAQLFVDYLTSGMTADDLEQTYSSVLRSAFEQADRAKQ